MTEWEPATETEAAMRDALRAGDQELYFRILARTDLLLPVSADALAGRAPMGWGTWTTGGRTHVLAFTSGPALQACLAENAGSTRRAPYAELASGWPNPEWWLAVNPGLPIEGYLPAWFVSQLSRGDVRLPGRSMGARARLEQVERAARARATASVPRRPAPARSDPEPFAAPAAPFPRTEPSGAPSAPFRPAEPSREPAGYPSTIDAASASPAADPASFRSPVEPRPFPTPVESRAFASSVESSSFGPPAESRGFESSFAPPAESRAFEPRPFPAAAEARAFESTSLAPPVESRASEAPVEPTSFSRAPGRGPGPDPVVPAEPTSPAAPPATVPVIAPTSDRDGRGGDFGSPISEDSSAGWMTPAGPGRSGSAAATNGGPAPTTDAWIPPADQPAPPPTWYGPTDQPTTPIDGPPTPASAATPAPPPAAPAPAPAPAPEPWTPTPTPTPAETEESLFTPVSRRSGDSWSEPAPERTAGAADFVPAERVSTDSASTEPIFAEPTSSSSPVPTEPTFSSPVPTEPTPSQPVFSSSEPTQPIFGDAGATERIFTPPVADPPPVRAEPPAAGPGPASVDPSGPGGAPADPAAARRLAADFVPANEVERSLLGAAGDGSTDTFLSTLLLARVLLPVAAGSAPGARPGDDGFEWRTESLDGETYVVVFTSAERIGDHLPEPVETVAVKFAQLIRRWPDDAWSFAVNPGTPVGAKLPGGQIVALANWAAEVGLGDDADAGEQPQPAPTEEEAPRSTYAPTREDPARPTMMQKTIAPSQLAYYLDRGYDRVSGFVHRASEVVHLRTPAKFYRALGLGYPGSPFVRDADEIYVLRWPAYRPSLYRIPYGGQSEPAMRAMEGWVIERPPFRGNGFAPGESSDVVAEFKVDSVRLPHGAQLHRIGVDGVERLVATLDCDVPVWRRAEED